MGVPDGGRRHAFRSLDLVASVNIGLAELRREQLLDKVIGRAHRQMHD
jgi:hypothetical protein